MYMITQAVTLLIIYIVGLFNKDIMNIINTTNIPNINAIKIIMFIGIAIYFVYNIIYYLIGKKFLGQGVNID